MIDLALFEQWLEENYDVTVGVTQSCSTCPIATFIQRTHEGIKQIMVTSYDIFVTPYGGDEYIVELPEWAQGFIYNVDRLNYNTPNSVFGSQALEVLRKVKVYYEDN